MQALIQGASLDLDGMHGTAGGDHRSSRNTAPQWTLAVHDGKGAKDRVTLLPPALVQPIRDQMERARQLHKQDLAAGLGEVYLPYALERKYPNAPKA